MTHARPRQPPVAGGALRGVTLQTIRDLPKAEVHVHLEGAIELADLIEAAAATGRRLPAPAARLWDASAHELDALPGGAGTSSLSAYLRFLDWEGSLFTTPEQVARLAYRFAARQSSSGVRYTDVIVNPTHWPTWSADPVGLLDALGAGFAEAAQDGLCPVGVCASLERGQGAAEAEELVSLIARQRPRGVVGLSVDGDEARHGRTAPRFAGAFAAARAAGLRRTAHAGESSGPEGVRDALDVLHAERIDHGVRAVEDSDLVSRLVEEQVPLGVCPSSNLALGLYPSHDEHPLAELAARGVAVTVNTDDPAALGTRLEVEWLLAATGAGWGLPELVDLARRSFAACFAEPDLVTAQLDELDAWRADERR